MENQTDSDNSAAVLECNKENLFNECNKENLFNNRIRKLNFVRTIIYYIRVTCRFKGQ